MIFVAFGAVGALVSKIQIDIQYIQKDIKKLHAKYAEIEYLKSDLVEIKKLITDEINFSSSDSRIVPVEGGIRVYGR